MELRLTINGEKQSLLISPRDILLDVLRREGHFGVKRGCNSGDCGTCGVLINGLPVNSCLVFAAQCEGVEVTTIEGIGTPDHPHPLQVAFNETGAVQCGFCTPGMVVSSYALLRRSKKPTDAEIREALEGNLCRCTGYVKPIEAVHLAAQRMAVKKREAASPLRCSSSGPELSK
ncbi:MAG: (2Fe-2S)-binding protein [bacterium]